MAKKKSDEFEAEDETLEQARKNYLEAKQKLEIVNKEEWEIKAKFENAKKAHDEIIVKQTKIVEECSQAKRDLCRAMSPKLHFKIEVNIEESKTSP